MNKTEIILSIFITGAVPALGAGNGSTPSLTPGVQDPQKPIPYIQKSTVFKKTPPSTTSPASAKKLGLDSLLMKRVLVHPAAGDYSFPLYPKASTEIEGPFFIRDQSYYDNLNDGLHSAMGYQPQVASQSEQIIGAVLGVAGKACAGVAAAQALGIIPSGQTKKK